MARTGNLIGKKVSKLRNERGLSQSKLAEMCQRLGWDLSREILAHIEVQTRSVTDMELSILAAALHSSIDELLPASVARSYVSSLRRRER